MPDDEDQGGGSLLMLALVALVAGALAGLVGAVFRLSLVEADRYRGALIEWAHGREALGFLIVVAACAAATALAAWLVRRFSPHASGSGIPHVEAVLRGELPPAPFLLIPVKFLGGVLAIGAGLALGREGPTVQMGASLAHLVGRIFRRTWPDCRVLMAAGAGAGLGTAFNAPIAGAVFVLEELVQRFERRIAIAALAASATAIGVARVALGDAPDFRVSALGYGDAATRPIDFAFGALAGLAAVAYNRALLATRAAARRLERSPVELRAGIVGAAVGVLAWFAPGLIGGGDAITQSVLAGGVALAAIPAAFLIRFALGAVSYAAATPGGLFAPMLVLGAQVGFLFGAICRSLLPHLDVQPEGFAVVGMAAFFTGVVRAPVTGIVLATEMTANVTMLLPMLCACAAAMLTATLLGDPPIYESLRERASPADRAA
ncbi:MAG: H(+)/Cl(-) exchange transporter ClcA [Hyphomicrobiales bacterium]|nr:H(+)/Cl(-) exchange transporter ClcA [Hyphomicrobiales bacterium]